jgi:tetratricopeptide (TPR) repeat protein
LNPASMDARFELADLYVSLGWFGKLRELLAPVPATGIWGGVRKTFFADADFLEKGDMSTRMSITPEKKPDGSIPFWNLKNAVYARDAERAGKILAELPANYFGDSYTLLYWKAATEQVRGDRPAMLRAYGEARAAAAKASQADPNDAEVWGDLGLFDAILGDKEEALKEGRRATELLPLDQDSVRGMELAVNLVYIYGWVGEKDRAFEELQRLMKIPRGPRYGHLRYYPQYDPLRDDPRFQKILASVAPKQAGSP